jgi:hypothetical protein
VRHAPAQVSHHIVVLLQDNTVASACVATAALLARPALDYVHLVHIAQASVSRDNSGHGWAYVYMELLLRAQGITFPGTAAPTHAFQHRMSRAELLDEHY